MKINSAQASIAIVCLVLGIMLAVQFRATESSEINMVPARVSDLTVKLQMATEERDALAQEVLTLRERLNNVRMNDDAMADLQEEMQKANMAAGLLALEGPGIIVKLNDSNKSFEKGEDPNALLVHDEDLLKIVNELRASGAEAISINEERLTSMSEIRCAGTTILVNWRKIAPPFEIKATGDPDLLESGLTIKGGYLEYLKFYGIEVGVEKKETVKIPSYNGSMKFAYSEPIN